MARRTRFATLVARLRARGDVRHPAALAAWIGRRKYGARRFARMAAAGRARSRTLRRLRVSHQRWRRALRRAA